MEETTKYFVISLDHTQKDDDWITLWRPNNAGYCYSRHMAGLYDEVKEGYHNSHDNVSIPEITANGLFISICIEGQDVQRIPNCKAVWDQLGFRKGKHNLERKQPYKTPEIAGK